MSAHAGEPVADDTRYKHRSCLACGKRIPRWQGGRATRADRVFCSEACAKFSRRRNGGSAPSKGVRDNVKKVPEKRAFLEPVRATEDRPDYAPCEACGRNCRIEPGEPAFCSEQCRSYVPLPTRKANGAWFIVAGPVNFCAACGLAITPTHGQLTPWRRGSALYCSADCRRARHKADEWLEGAAS
jgi:hypothetical protein